MCVAVKPVASAALFVLLFSSLYAIIGVTFFETDFEEWFGTFLSAQLTLMQVRPALGSMDVCIVIDLYAYMCEI